MLQSLKITVSGPFQLAATLKRSRMEVDAKAKPIVKKKTRAGVEYESDSSLRDSEQIPLNTPGGIEGYIDREVLPLSLIHI